MISSAPFGHGSVAPPVGTALPSRDQRKRILDERGEA